MLQLRLQEEEEKIAAKETTSFQIRVAIKPF